MAFTFGPRLPSFPLSTFDFYHTAEAGITIGSAGEVELWEDQINSYNWIASSPTTGLQASTDLNGRTRLFNDAGSRMFMSPGFNTPNPFTIYFLCRVRYTSNFGSVFRSLTASRNQNQIEHRSGGDSGIMWGASSGNLNINGIDGINWWVEKNQLLDSATSSFPEEVGYHLLKFVWTDTGFTMSRDNRVVKSGNTPSGLLPFAGDDIYLGFSIFWDFVWMGGGFRIFSALEDAAVTKYTNDFYSLNLSYPS